MGYQRAASPGVTLTNDTEPDITVIEREHRGHARVENRIKNLKDTGLSRLPFHDWDANRVWVELVQIAGCCWPDSKP